MFTVHSGYCAPLSVAGAALWAAVGGERSEIATVGAWLEEHAGEPDGPPVELLAEWKSQRWTRVFVARERWAQENADAARYRRDAAWRAVDVEALPPATRAEAAAAEVIEAAGHAAAARAVGRAPTCANFNIPAFPPENDNEGLDRRLAAVVRQAAGGLDVLSRAVRMCKVKMAKASDDAHAASDAFLRSHSGEAVDVEPILAYYRFLILGYSAELWAYVTKEITELKVTAAEVGVNLPDAR